MVQSQRMAASNKNMKLLAPTAHMILDMLEEVVLAEYQETAPKKVKHKIDRHHSMDVTAVPVPRPADIKREVERFRQFAEHTESVLSQVSPDQAQTVADAFVSTAEFKLKKILIMADTLYGKMPIDQAKILSSVLTEVAERINDPARIEQLIAML